MNWEFFIHGCIGALAPEVVRLYNLRQIKNRVKFSRFYFIISVLYIGLGGYIASIFPGISKAFWAACIGSSTVLNVNMMIKIGTSLFSRLAKRPGFEESYKKAIRMGGKPALARSVYELEMEQEKEVADEIEKGDFLNYAFLL
ncbi:MAG: hypothetical protein ACFFDT_08510 [Candidatus Hodarchaeota archaeon]